MFRSITDKKQIESLALIAEIKKQPNVEITSMQYKDGNLMYFVESRAVNFVWLTKKLPLDIAIKIESVIS